MIFDADMTVVAKAAERWRERSGVRESREGRSVASIETPKRLEARLERLSDAARPGNAPATRPDSPQLDAALLKEIGLERTIGASDYQNIAFLEIALAVSRFVGRISIKSSPSRRIGFGTGSMVAPRLLLTNNHVLPSEAEARYSEIEFDYQLDRDGKHLQAYPFALRPDLFFMTDVDLDFTLVAVEETSKLDRALKHYGWTRLIAAEGKILIGEHVNIIQHPRGDFKQFVTRENEVIDLLDDFLHYVTDTEPGSSGSPVYNDQWEIVALHHSGVPRMIDAQYIDKRGNPWNGIDPEDIDWVANEGVRVSKIVQFVQAAPLTGEKARMRDDLLNLEPPHPLEAARLAETSAISTPKSTPPSPTLASTGKGVSMTIPLRITIEIGDPAGEDSHDRQIVERPAPEPAAAIPSTEEPPGVAPALAELRRSASRVYNDAEADAAAREQYYAGLPTEPVPSELFATLRDLLAQTHRHRLIYAPAEHVYPWVDLRPGTPLIIRSIYSGKRFDPAELIRADAVVGSARARAAEAMVTSGAGIGLEAASDLLESQLPFNCEHVVPQSWFSKREPMRGDLHHLFACDPGCNSFRGNSPYHDFPEFEEAFRDDCGKREKIGFEPAAGKGAVARATLYFMLRYPGVIGDAPGELSSDDLCTLLAWHDRHPVDDYERHRNAAIFDKQGNRNPLIDHPEWAERIDFKRGIGGSQGAVHPPESERPLAGAIAAVATIMRAAEASGERVGVEAAPSGFGHYVGLPAQLALLPDGRLARLLAALTYHSEDGAEWIAPVGAEVDGASIPPAFWSLIGGPFEGRYREASIIHDVHCVSRGRPWADTHRMFYEAMRCSGVGETKAKIMYYAVRRFGPRWGLARLEATAERRSPSDADAGSIVTDATFIAANGLGLDEIDHLADAHDGS